MYFFKTNLMEVKGVFVIVHGAGEYHVRYQWVREQLNKLGYHVIIGDLSGQGLTEGPRGHVNSFSDYTTTVKKWLIEAKKYELPIYMLSHSMGGLITIQLLTMLHKSGEEHLLPDAVVLSSPCLGLVNKQSPFKEILSYGLNYLTPGLRFQSNVPRGAGTRDEVMRARDLQDSRLIRRVSVRWYRELQAAMKRAMKSANQFPTLPLLVMQAGDDRIVDKECVKEWFQALSFTDRHYKEYEGLYHEVLNEPEREKVLEDLISFVSDPIHFFK